MARKRGRKRRIMRRAGRKVATFAGRAKSAYRRAASMNVSGQELIISAAGAGVGGIGATLVIKKLPASIPAVAKNLGVAVLGALIMKRGLKSKSFPLIGAGLGMAGVGAKGLVTKFVPSLAGDLGDDEDFTEIAGDDAYEIGDDGEDYAVVDGDDGAELVPIDADEVGDLNAPLAAPFAAPFDGEDYELEGQEI